MKTLKLTQEIPFPPEEVFAAMTTPERLARWWGPEGFSNTFEICEMRPGGKWKFIMHGPDGKDYPNESEFGEIISPKKFVVRHTCEPIFTATFNLSRTENGTLLEWISEFENERFVESYREFLENANQQNIERLINELK